MHLHLRHLELDDEAQGVGEAGELLLLPHAPHPHLALSYKLGEGGDGGHGVPGGVEHALQPRHPPHRPVGRLKQPGGVRCQNIFK